MTATNAGDAIMKAELKARSRASLRSMRISRVRMRSMDSTKDSSQLYSLMTLMPWSTSLVSLTRSSVSLTMACCHCMSLRMTKACTGISRTMTASPAKEAGPR